MAYGDFVVMNDLNFDVRSGEIKLVSGGESVELKQGDSAQYTADVDHCLENTGQSDAVIVLVDIYASDLTTG